MGTTSLTEVLIGAPRLLAEGNPAEAQDPAREAENPEEDPLKDRLFVLDLRQALLATRVALNFERFHVASWYCIWCDHGGRSRRHYVGDRWGLSRCIRLLDVLDGVQVSHRS